MRILLIIFSIAFLSCADKKIFELPATWQQDLTIHIYSGGGMNYESIDVWLNQDSCKYVHMEQGIDTVKRFKLSATEQSAVLKKLRDFNVEFIKSTKNKGIIHDKETTRLCLSQGTKDHCIETGAATYVQEKYAKDFYEAYMYLYKIALQKAK